MIEGSDTHAQFTVRTNKSPNAEVPIRFSFDRTYLPSGESSKTGTNQDHPVTLDFRAETKEFKLQNGTITSAVEEPKT